MTKEMRPSHRIDVLSDAILYYARSCKEKLGNYILCIIAEEPSLEIIRNTHVKPSIDVKQYRLVIEFFYIKQSVFLCSLGFAKELGKGFTMHCKQHRKHQRAVREITWYSI